MVSWAIVLLAPTVTVWVFCIIKISPFASAVPLVGDPPGFTDHVPGVLKVPDVLE